MRKKALPAYLLDFIAVIAEKSVPAVCRPVRRGTSAPMRRTA